MDCRAVFDDAGCAFLASTMLDGALHAMEDRPWGDYRGRPLTGQQRGRWLHGFGVQPGKRQGVRGYYREDFEPAWGSYGSRPSETVRTVRTVQSTVNVDGAIDGMDGSDGLDPPPADNFPVGALGTVAPEPAPPAPPAENDGRHPPANPSGFLKAPPPAAEDAMHDNAPETAPPKKADPTIEELHHHATAAGADLVLTAAGAPIWWYEADGSLHVAVEYPAEPGDPNPSGDSCSRCGRPWSAATGPGWCSRCDAGAEWDDDDRERRLRRLATDDLRGLAVSLVAQVGRDRELTIIRDELAHREVH